RHDVGAVTGTIERKREAGIAVLEHDRDRAVVAVAGLLDPNRDAQIGRGPHLDGHLDAAHGPAQHNVIARKLDHAHAPVRGPVAGTDVAANPTGEGEGAGRLAAARPAGKAPALSCLTPQSYAPRRVCPRSALSAGSSSPRSLPQTCRKHFGIRLMFLVNLRY